MRFKRTAGVLSSAALVLGLSGTSTVAAVPTGYSYCAQSDNTAPGGATVNMTAFAPHLETPTSHSLGEVLVSNGAATVEVGWTVDNARYTDKLPHLFVYSTPDHYATGGYDALSAYVPVDHTVGSQPSDPVLPGANLGYGIVYYAQAGPGFPPAWWISFAGRWIGYVPVSAVAGMTQATTTQVYGEVYDPPGTSQTSEMAFQAAGFSPVGYNGLTLYTLTYPYRIYDRAGTGMFCFGGA